AGDRLGAGAHRAIRRVLREPPALPERGLLLGDHLPGHGVSRRDVPGAVRDRPHGRLACPVGGGDPRPRAAHLPAPADLRGPRGTPPQRRRGVLTGTRYLTGGRAGGLVSKTAPLRPIHSGTTTVLMILSAKVCRLASHSGNSQPM